MASSQKNAGGTQGAGMKQLEVCCDSVQSAIAAQSAGAARVELCDNLLQGGTTPSAGMLSLVRQHVSIGLHVLIRPRAGDFCYDDLELETMRRDIVAARQQGADGVVLGLLLPDGSIDRTGMGQLIALARPMRITFHRAFDLARDPQTALEDIIALGADYLLTSGQQPTAVAGRELIARLQRQANGRILVMPGGGVNEHNIRELAIFTGCNQFHSSGRSLSPSRMQFRRENVTMGAWAEGEYAYSIVDQERIRRMITELSQLVLC